MTTVKYTTTYIKMDYGNNTLRFANKNTDPEETN